MSSAPLPGVVRRPFATVQDLPAMALLSCQPVRSLPLNNSSGFPHFGSPACFNEGARSPVQVHDEPVGPFVVPVRRRPASLPSKGMLSLRSHSSCGETNVSVPPLTAISSTGSAWFHWPTMSPCSWPSFKVISIQPGYSRSGVLTVRSQRPRNGLAASACAPERSPENAVTLTTRQETARRIRAEYRENLVIQTPCTRKNEFKIGGCM